MERDSFSAVHSMSGYDYQVRQAVLRLFDLKPGTSLGVERLDDIHTEKGGHPDAAVSVKHHQGGHVLTEKSADWWKSLRIWAEKVCVGPEDTWPSQLIILTTSKVQSTSVFDGWSQRSVTERDERLESIAKEMSVSNKELGSSANAYLALKKKQRRELLRRIVILSEQGSLAEIDSQIDDRLAYLTFDPQYCPEVRRLLIRHTWESALDGSHIIHESTFRELLRAYRTRFSDKLAPLSLRFASEPLPGDLSLTARDALFVQQLRVIQADDLDISTAIENHWRAVHQLTYWLSNLEVLSPALHAYEDDLKRVVTAGHKKVKLLSRSSSTVEDIAMAGRLFYYDVQGWPSRELDSRPAPVFFQHGWLQDMAGRVVIGWHPDFEKMFGE